MERPSSQYRSCHPHHIPISHLFKHLLPSAYSLALNLNRGLNMHSRLGRACSSFVSELFTSSRQCREPDDDLELGPVKLTTSQSVRPNASSHVGDDSGPACLIKSWHPLPSNMSDAELGEIRLSRARQFDYFCQNDPEESIASIIGPTQDRITRVEASISRIEGWQQEKDYSVSMAHAYIVQADGTSCSLKITKGRLRHY
jgi:hypothetical protein